MIRFINQVQMTRRCEKHGEHKSDWEDSCIGHETYDQAITCGELMSQVLDGKISQSELVDTATLALTAWLGSMEKQAGMKREFRIVKRTITEEVLDA